MPWRARAMLRQRSSRAGGFLAHGHRGGTRGGAGLMPRPYTNAVVVGYKPVERDGHPDDCSCQWFLPGRVCRSIISRVSPIWEDWESHSPSPFSRQPVQSRAARSHRGCSSSTIWKGSLASWPHRMNGMGRRNIPWGGRRSRRTSTRRFAGSRAAVRACRVEDGHGSRQLTGARPHSVDKMDKGASFDFRDHRYDPYSTGINGSFDAIVCIGSRTRPIERLPSRTPRPSMSRGLRQWRRSHGDTHYRTLGDTLGHPGDHGLG